MRTTSALSVAALAFGWLGAVAAPGLAQPQATPGVPANQTGPKPARLADGRPNWTGFWTPIGGLLDQNFGPGAKARPPAATAGGAQVPRSPASPLKSPYKEKYEQILQDAAAGKVTYDPAGLCLPPGMPRMMGATYGLELLQTPSQVTITSEWQAESRRIWTDGRKHPNPDEALPTYSGHSIGHWDGDTLVVETVQTRADSLIDQSGLPHSERMRIDERFSSPQPGVLTDQITITDPDVYTTPWSMTKRYRYRPDLNLQEYVCEENNRNVGSNGEPTFK
jgi:hypothetical protein